MEAARIKMTLARAKFHARILCRGFFRTVYGALIAGLIAMAIYGFISVTTETGWIAVCDFIAACATMAAATKEYGCFRDPGYVHHSWIDELEPL